MSSETPDPGDDMAKDKPKIPSRYTLITNLDYVIVGQVRTSSHALLVESCEHPLMRGEARHQLRGFCTTPSVPTFDIDIPSYEFSLEDAASHNIMTLRHGEDEPTPLMHGAIMHIPGFVDVQLIAGVNSRRGLDVKRYPDNTDIGQVWADLELKVLEYWEAPNIMVPQWHPAATLRAIGMARGWR